MKIILTSILMLSIVSSLFSQIDNYPKYRELINQAESQLIANEKESALSIYQNAFTSVKGNHVKDIHNSLLLAYELDQKDTFFKLLDLMIIKDLDSKIIKRKFYKYHNDPRWTDFIVRNDVYKAPKRLFKHLFDSLHSIDQEFRMKVGSYEKYGDTINSIDSMNYLFIYDLIQSNSFPGEDEMGVNNFHGSYGYDIVFHHLSQQYSLDRKKPNLVNPILKLVQQGLIHPSTGALWIDYHCVKDNSCGTMSVFKLKSKMNLSDFYVDNYKDGFDIVIDQTRAKLGLQKHCFYLRTIKFKNENKTNYLLDGHTNIFDVGPEMAKKFKEFSTPLDEVIQNFCQ